MSITYGLSDSGFTPEPQDAILAAIDADQQSAFGASFNVGDGGTGTGSRGGKSVVGVFNGIVTESFALLWLLLEAIVSSQRSGAATGISLQELCALTGTVKSPATSSTAVVTLVGTNGITVPAESLIATASTNVQFETASDATIVTLASWATGTPYVFGNLVKNAGNVYYCVQTGTSLGSGGGPTDTIPGIADNTVVWNYIAAGSAAVNVTADSLDTGPVVAVAGDLTAIVNRQFGWDSASNAQDATKGVAELTDEQLRTLRDQELGGEGKSPADSIRAALLKVTNVTTVTVFMNLTDVTDANGLPPHSVRALVQGGADQDIYDALLANVAAGIVTDGTSVGASVDSNGTSQTVKFSRPTAQPVYVDITYVYDPATFPADGDTQIKSAIATYGNKQPAGRDAVAAALGAQAFTVIGVNDVPRSGSLGGTLIRLTPGPVSDATLVMTSFQLATYDALNITTHGTPGTP